MYLPSGAVSETERWSLRRRQRGVFAIKTLFHRIENCWRLIHLGVPRTFRSDVGDIESERARLDLVKQRVLLSLDAGMTVSVRVRVVKTRDRD